jgi:heptosyltransferase-2
VVRGVNWLGDAVMTTPALQRLREALPDAHLTLLTHEKLADLWQHHPSLNSIITFSPGENPWLVARRLRAENFQAALVLPNSPRSALEVWLARIPLRIGYARPWRNRLLPASRRTASPTRATIISTWQPRWARTLSLSRQDWRSPRRKCARRRTPSYRTDTPEYRALFPRSL